MWTMDNTDGFSQDQLDEINDLHAELMAEYDGDMPGGFRVVDANGILLAYVYARDDLAGKTGGNAWLTRDEAWRIARGIARLPDLMARGTD